MRVALSFALAQVLLLGITPALAQNTAQSTSPASRGELVALASDCAGCHANPDGSSDYAGGLALDTPMGTIYARNITPDKDTGIGSWTLEDFSDAVRDGKSKALGRLYPAMPYTSYHGMTDEDVSALYDFIMKEVKPVNHAVPETDLGFPFLRPSMLFWDAMFADSGKAPAVDSSNPAVQRGAYLVNVLGHCGECHTPRGGLYQLQSSSKHLSGSVVGGWHAPNITSDTTGIGDWPAEKLKKFLSHGKVRGANAGGDMGLAVRMSLSQFPDSDLDAMVAYLKATKPIAGQPLAPVVSSVAPIDLTRGEPVNSGYKDFADSSTTDGEVLYLSACATCHGVNGALDDGGGPNLTQSSAVRAASPVNIVHTIATGIDLDGLDTDHLMPSFRSEFNDAQIAAVASYVRQRFGGYQDTISESQAKEVLAGSVGASWLMLNARWLAWVGVLVVIAVIVGILMRLLRR